MGQISAGGCGSLDGDCHHRTVETVLASNHRFPPPRSQSTAGQVGTGDDFAYPTEAPPMNASLYRARLTLMKQYGFDFVRLHSHFEAPGFFEAADEVGMIVRAVPSAARPPTDALEATVVTVRRAGPVRKITRLFAAARGSGSPCRSRQRCRRGAATTSCCGLGSGRSTRCGTPLP